MRPRKPSKPTEAVQVNLRINEQLRRQLEAAANEHRVTFSQEVRARLVDSFGTKARPSLASSLADFGRGVRDIVEHSARKEDIEPAWRLLRAIEAMSAVFYTGVEEKLLPYVQNPKVRELLRGAPQEQEKGGKA